MCVSHSVSALWGKHEFYTPPILTARSEWPPWEFRCDLCFEKARMTGCHFDDIQYLTVLTHCAIVTDRRTNIAIIHIARARMRRVSKNPKLRKLVKRCQYISSNIFIASQNLFHLQWVILRYETALFTAAKMKVYSTHQ